MPTSPQIKLPLTPPQLFISTRLSMRASHLENVVTAWQRMTHALCTHSVHFERSENHFQGCLLDNQRCSVVIVSGHTRGKKWHNDVKHLLKG